MTTKEISGLPGVSVSLFDVSPDRVKASASYQARGKWLFKTYRDGEIESMKQSWVHHNFYRFLTHFNGIRPHELLNFSYLNDAYYWNDTNNQGLSIKSVISQVFVPRTFDLMYGRLNTKRNKYDVAAYLDSDRAYDTFEGDASDLYFIVKSVFFFRYISSQLRLMTPTYKPRLKHFLDQLSFSEVYEGINLLPPSEDKDKLLQLVTTPVIGLRKKYGRRDLSIKEYFDV